jgi:recombination protein RecR
LCLCGKKTGDANPRSHSLEKCHHSDGAIIGEKTTVYARPLARLIEQLQRLPGVGPKTAQRLALHILKRPEAEVQALAQALTEAKQQVGLCSVCFHLSAEPMCEICRNANRDNNTICVVADSRDLIAVEKTREYHGKYHVLGGVISPMDGIGPEQLTSSILSAASQSAKY